jgi:hypothetical protein
MKTFESCNRVWLTMPEGGEMPAGLSTFVRILTQGEKERSYGYNDVKCSAKSVLWGCSWAGWYPVHADGTDDHETAKRFATGPRFTPRPPRPRIIRRRFRLSTR